MHAQPSVFWLTNIMEFARWFPDINECEQSPSVCDENAECENIIGSYKCTCRTGYTGNGKECTGTPLSCWSDLRISSTPSTSWNCLLRGSWSSPAFFTIHNSDQLFPVEFFPILWYVQHVNVYLWICLKNWILIPARLITSVFVTCSVQLIRCILVYK